MKALLSAALILITAPAFAQSDDPSDQSDDSRDVYYENCTAARAAGAAPIYVGEPGYRRKLDRDGDGVACE
jgi:Excalibur calcium-binding domain